MVKASTFIAGACLGRQAVQAASAQELELPKGFQGRFLRQSNGGGLWGWEQLTDIHLTGGEAVRSQLQLSGSNRSGVYVLVDSTQLMPSTWRGSQTLQNSSKDMAQNILYSPWGGTKGLWLCLMDKLLLFWLAWLFSFLSVLSQLLWWKSTLWSWGSLEGPSFSTDRRRAEDMGLGRAVLGKPHRVLPSYTSDLLLQRELRNFTCLW